MRRITSHAPLRLLITKQICVFALLLISFTASADYIVVKRNANFRKSANSTSAIIGQFVPGDTLILQSPNKRNGYFKVSPRDGSKTGWVYGNLVSRVEGEIPVTETTAFVSGPNGESVEVRVVDVGAGLCTLIKMPGNKYLIYDAGGARMGDGNATYEVIKSYIPEGSSIELLVLSHDDADHIVAAEQVIKGYNVKKVLWTGLEKRLIVPGEPQSKPYKRLLSALAQRPNTAQENLLTEGKNITTGEHFSVGEVKFTLLCGFGKPLDDWDELDPAEKMNGVSIVMKMEYDGKSVLFTGDAVGRHRDDPDGSLRATEKYLVNNAAAYLKSDVIIAPHHGAKNGNSEAFVDLVKPEYVIFSAGHEYSHPTQRSANNYLHYTTKEKMFRTDRGDDEGTATEWNYLKIPGCKDKPGDDDVQISLKKGAPAKVYYLKANAPCVN